MPDFKGYVLKDDGGTLLEFDIHAANETNAKICASKHYERRVSEGELPVGHDLMIVREYDGLRETCFRRFGALRWERKCAIINPQGMLK